MIGIAKHGAGAAGVLAFVTERTGLQFPDHRRGDAETQVAEAMDRAGIADPDGFVAHLRNDGPAEEALIGELVVGETYFYREPALFEYLRTSFLPRLARERGPEYLLRVWSAGCGSGEEAYSVAMLLEEAGLGGRSIVLGTDVSGGALGRARQAMYGSWSFRGTDEALLLRYFTGTAGRFVLTDAIRRRVRFERHNLATDAYPPAAAGDVEFDLILCRNVLFYLTPGAVERVVAGLSGSLSADGVLFTGQSDPALDRVEALRQIPSDAVIMYERRRNPSAAPAVAGTAAARRPVAPVAAGTGGAVAPEASFIARVLAQANRDGASAAATAAGQGKLRYPASAALPFLEAVLLAGSGRHAEAVAAARNALYLDRSQPAIHFVLGASLWNLGDLDGARRGFRNAYELARALPAGAIVPLTEGETAGRVARGAAAQLAMLAPAVAAR